MTTVISSLQPTIRAHSLSFVSTPCTWSITLYCIYYLIVSLLLFSRKYTFTLSFKRASLDIISFSNNVHQRFLEKCQCFPLFFITPWSSHRPWRRWTKEWRQGIEWRLQNIVLLLSTPWWGAAGSRSPAGDPPSTNWGRNWSLSTATPPALSPDADPGL